MNHDWEALTPEAVIETLLAEHPGEPICLTCSFQVEDMLVLDWLRSRRPDIPVLFLDTGYHFAATYAYRDQMAQAWKLNLINVLPERTVAEQEARFGLLNRTDPGRCCQLRKVEPLMRSLQPYSIWFTGLRREQSPTRRNLGLVETHVLPSGKSLLKVSPLARWDSKQVWREAYARGFETLPLYHQGYTSIGCEPCTAIPAAGADPRSGRWGGAKLECGIHTFTQHEEAAPSAGSGASQRPEDRG